MQKRMSVFFPLCILTLGSVFCSSALAADKLIYCPKTVTCVQNNDGKVTCTPDGDEANLKYWDAAVNSMYGYPNSPILPGVYQFNNVTATFHFPMADMMQTACSYYGNSSLSLPSKTASNLEAYADGMNGWGPSPTSMASCSGIYPDMDPTVCPLKEQSALTVFNKNTSAVSVSAANFDLLEDTLTANEYGKVPYIYALEACGTENLCKIDIATSKEGHIGSVTVDMNNKMKIQQISSTKSHIAIRQIDTFNSVEVVDTRDLPSVKITNSIYATVGATVNGASALDQPIFYGSSHVYFDRVAENCSADECEIQLITTSENKNAAVGLIGTITVDMKNGMAVTKVVPFRANEIGLFSTDSHSVEVRYVNK